MYMYIHKYRYIYVHMYMYIVICAYTYMCIYFFPPDEQTNLTVFLEASPSVCAVKTEEVLRSMFPL